MLLGCTYTEKHVEALGCIKEHVEFKDGSIVPILRRQAHPPIKAETPEPKVIPTRRRTKDFDAIRVARPVTIPPRSEIMIPATVGQRGLRLVEGREELWEKKRLIIANGVARVQPTEWFWIQVANLNEHTVKLLRRERLATAMACPVSVAPSEINLIPESVHQAEGCFSKEEISQPYRDLWDNISQISFEDDDSVAHKIALNKAEESNNREAEPSIDDVSLGHFTEQQKTQVRASLGPYEELFSSKLGAIT